VKWKRKQPGRFAPREGGVLPVTSRKERAAAKAERIRHADSARNKRELARLSARMAPRWRAADGHGRSPEQDRITCLALEFWRFCPRKCCKRARVCSGDAAACFAHFWPQVPIEVRAIYRRALEHVLAAKEASGETS
jgi:hypothetical protein